MTYKELKFFIATSIEDIRLNIIKEITNYVKEHGGSVKLAHNFGNIFDSIIFDEKFNETKLYGTETNSYLGIDYLTTDEFYEVVASFKDK